MPIAGEVLDIVRRAVSECKEPVKLIHFTDSYMHSSLANGLYISNNRLLSTNLEEDARLEEEMSKEDARQALTRWIALISLKHPKAGRKWKRMVSRYVFSMSEDDHPWPVQRRYIELLRPVTAPHIKKKYPNWKVTKNWAASKRWVEAREKEKLEERLRFISAAQHAHGDDLPHPQSFRAGPVASSSSSFRPTSSSLPPRGAPRGRGGAPARSSRPVQSSSMVTTADQPSKWFCMVCGDHDHSPKNCAAECQVNGEPIRLVKGAANEWLIPPNIKFCYNNNSLRGCQASIGCPNGKHVCSRCLSPGHNAPHCNGTSAL